jgi:hypothetical protein
LMVRTVEKDGVKMRVEAASHSRCAAPR